MKAFINLFMASILASGGAYFYFSKNPEPEIKKEPISQKPLEKIEPEIKKEPFTQKLHLLYQNAQYEKALEEITSYLKANPDSNLKVWLERQRPIIMTSLGWKLFEDNKPFLAIDSFEEALALAPIELAYKGLAASYFKLRYLWQAENYARRYLELNENDRDSYLILMETLELSGNLEEAYAYALKLAGLESLSSEDKKEAQKKLRTLKARLEESRKQVQIDSSFFSLNYRPEYHELEANWIIETLEKSLDDLHLNWGLHHPKGKIQVIVYLAQDFSNMIHGPSWAGAIYDGRIRLPLKYPINYQNLERILRHELSHALLAQQTNHVAMPAWFVEGLAQLVECEGGCVPSGRFGSEVKFNLEESFLGLSERKAKIAYKKSFARVYEIRSEYGGSGFRDLLNQIRDYATFDNLQSHK